MNYFIVAHIYFAATLVLLGVGTEGRYLVPFCTFIIALFYGFLIGIDRKEQPKPVEVKPNNPPKSK